MIKVSVLVPIYNVEKYLPECLNSLLSQNLQELEIICIDDGSTDGSAEIIDAFVARDARFRVIHKANSGYGKSMNMGLCEAQGEYIGIVESDDFVEPDMFSSMYETAHAEKADVVKSSFWVYANGHDTYADVIADELYGKVLSADDSLEVFSRSASPWSNIYRKAFLEEYGIRFFESPGASFQDIAWRVKVFACAKRAIFLKKAFYHYRRDNESASVRSEGKLYCVCDEYDEAERFLCQRDDWNSLYKYLLPYLRYVSYHWNCFDRWLSLRKKWEFYQRMRSEFLRFDEQGLIKRQYWPRWAWFNIQELLYDSNKFFCDQYVQFTNKRILLDGFLPMISDATKLAVYGAGKVGREALSLLCMYYKAPDCFVVTNLEDNSETIESVPVCSVEEIKLSRDDYVVLIAVTDNAQAEILVNLLEWGFRKIVLFSSFFRHNLK